MCNTRGWHFEGIRNCVDMAGILCFVFLFCILYFLFCICICNCVDDGMFTGQEVAVDIKR